MGKTISVELTVGGLHCCWHVQIVYRTTDPATPSRGQTTLARTVYGWQPYDRSGQGMKVKVPNLHERLKVWAIHVYNT